MNNKKALILVDNYFEQVELTSPKQALEAEGVTVDIVAPEADKVTGLHHLKHGDEFIVSKTLDEVSATDYDVIVIPGGVVNADQLRMKAKARELMQDFSDAKKPMAVICHGPWLLASSGLASGKMMTSYFTLQDDLRNAGAEWVDEEVVVDGNLITSRNPDDLPAFNRALLEVLR